MNKYLILENLQCFSSDDRVTESYPILLVRTDVSRDNKGQILNLTSYNGIAYQESQGNFEPSFPLTCAVVKRLFEQKNIKACLRILMQSQNKDNGTGWHAQNTLINYRGNAGQIIHYPHTSDYPSDYGHAEINSSRPRIVLPFDSSGFSDCLLEEALKRSNFRDFIKNLTGLQDPEFLIELGNYFEKPVEVWTGCDIDRVSSTWVDYSSSFDLICLSNLSNINASRGVRVNFS